MARSLVIIAVLVVVLHESYGRPSESTAWTSWKAQYSRRYYTKEEELVRWKSWVKNNRLVDENNRAYDEGRRSFKMAMNEFADQDMSKVRNKFDVQANLLNAERKRKSSGTSSSSSTLPSSWDWRKEGKVNPVRNQGQMNSALPMNVADAVASYSSIYDQTYLYALSVDEVVDCCLPDPFEHPHVFDCVHDQDGLCLDGSYHSGSAPNVCNNASCKAVASSNVGKSVTQGNESALAEAVYFTPVVVAIDASQPSFQLYVSGVYSDPNCSSTLLDLSLLLVGYGVSSVGTEYWICRNTWGEEWGDNGYINIARNHNNMCGIATDAIYPSNK
eukprot:XP_780996.2 PREDICTED: cathepsin L1 [Strongylocentrotus purpuratus]